MREPRCSVVIPAHNEAAVLSRTLQALFSGVDAADLDVVVACNGCSDDTAEVARRSGFPVRVVETATGSKIAGLRLGDSATSVFPRIYLDADVDLPGPSALLVADVLATGDVMAARPPLRYLTEHVTWLVRRYYSARSSLPEVLDSLWGAGCYAVSAAGHARIAPWPDVVADDLYVDRSFARTEIRIVDAAPVGVRVPRDSGALLRVLGRVYGGKHDQLPEANPVSGEAGPAHTLGRTIVGLLRLTLRRPSLIVDLAAYAGFAVTARLIKIIRGMRNAQAWERDETSRVA